MARYFFSGWLEIENDDEQDVTVESDLLSHLLEKYGEDHVGIDQFTWMS